MDYTIRRPRLNVSDLSQLSFQFRSDDGGDHHRPGATPREWIKRSQGACDTFVVQHPCFRFHDRTRLEVISLRPLCYLV